MHYSVYNVVITKECAAADGDLIGLVALRFAFVSRPFHYQINGIYPPAPINERRKNRRSYALCKNTTKSIPVQFGISATQTTKNFFENKKMTKQTQFHATCYPTTQYIEMLSAAPASAGRSAPGSIESRGPRTASAPHNTNHGHPRDTQNPAPCG